MSKYGSNEMNTESNRTILLQKSTALFLFHTLEDRKTYIKELLPAPIKTTPPTTADTIIIVLELLDDYLQLNLSSLRS